MDEKSKLNWGKMEVQWKISMKKILDDALCSEQRIHQQMDIYDELIRAHKKIYGKYHDVMWLSGDSRTDLNTYLLIRILCMLGMVSDSVYCLKKENK